MRSTISWRLLPPIPQWGKRVDSYRRSCRIVGLPTEREGFSGTGKGPIPLREKGGGEADTKMVTTMWCMFDSFTNPHSQLPSREWGCYTASGGIRDADWVMGKVNDKLSFEIKLNSNGQPQAEDVLSEEPVAVQQRGA